MYKNIFIYVCMNSFLICSQVKKEDIVLKDICHEYEEFDHPHFYKQDRSYNEQRRDSLPASSLIRHASTSIVSQRTNREVIDIPGVQRVCSDDNPTINVAATIAVKTDAECCNSRCCIDEDVQCRCSIQ